MPKLFVSFELTYPNKPSKIENTVIDHEEPASERDILFLQLKIHNKLPEDIRPIKQPTIIWFRKLDA